MVVGQFEYDVQYVGLCVVEFQYLCQQGWVYFVYGGVYWVVEFVVQVLENCWVGSWGVVGYVDVVGMLQQCIVVCVVDGEVGYVVFYIGQEYWYFQL